MNKLLRNLAQNLNTLQKNLPTSQYELGFKSPHAEGLINKSLSHYINNEGTFTTKSTEEAHYRCEHFTSNAAHFTSKGKSKFDISGFHHGVTEAFDLLGSYVA